MEALNMRKLTLWTLVVVIGIVGYTAFKNRTDNNTPAVTNANTAGKVSTPIGGSIYLQRDKRWANDTIGGSGEKFGDVGCTVCCICMAMEYCGINIDPGELNKRLKENGGYTDKGWVKWFTAAEVTGNKVTIEMPKKPTTEKIDETLKLGYPVIAKGVTRWNKIPHWVLIVAKDGEDYLIKDSLGDGKKLDKFSKYGDDILSIRIFKSKTSKAGTLKTPSPAPKPRHAAPVVPDVIDNTPDDFSRYTMPARATLKIRSKVGDGVWKSVAAVCPLKGEAVMLKVDKVSGANIRWYQIIPDITTDYNNAYWPWDKKAYQWKGFDKIAYAKRELTGLRGKWQIDPLAKRASGVRTDADKIMLSPFYHEDVGSFWYQAVVIKDGKMQRSAGIEESNHQGISPAVFRVSVRQGGGYIGYLTSFYNVPGIFGSVTAQSNNYVGVDCADVLMAAYGQWKNKPMPKNYNVSMLASSLTTVAQFDMSDGTCPKNLRWKTDIRPGDFIAVKYPSSRQYGHIGALHSDTNKNGILDENDNIIHAGPSALHISKLKEGNFNGHVKIIRP